MILVKREKQLGFTLLELITVIAIAATLLAIAIPNINRYIQNYNLKTAARTLEGDIQSAKQKSIAESTNYTILFDVANNNYTINPTAITKNFNSFGNITLANTGNINNNTITLQSRGTADTTTNQDTITLNNKMLSQASIQTTSMGKVNVSYTLK
jgi:type IV fimbrial biogenesis protein FimT